MTELCKNACARELRRSKLPQRVCLGGRREGGGGGGDKGEAGKGTQANPSPSALQRLCIPVPVCTRTHSPCLRLCLRSHSVAQAPDAVSVVSSRWGKSVSSAPGHAVYKEVVGAHNTCISFLRSKASHTLTIQVLLPRTSRRPGQGCSGRGGASEAVPDAIG